MQKVASFVRRVVESQWLGIKLKALKKGLMYNGTGPVR